MDGRIISSQILKSLGTTVAFTMGCSFAAIQGKISWSSVILSGILGLAITALLVIWKQPFGHEQSNELERER